MAGAKRFIVLGLGSFGSALATRLCENGCRVTGLDRIERNLERLKHLLYEAVVGNATDRETLQQLLLPNADAVFISLGESIERSILAALHARELGARQIYVKGVSDDHRLVLEKVGVDRVIFPEAETAFHLADQVTWPNVLEQLQIDPEYSIVETSVPDSLAGKSLQELELRTNYGIFVLGIKDALMGKLIVIPRADFILSGDQTLLAIAKQADFDRFRELK